MHARAMPTFFAAPSLRGFGQPFTSADTERQKPGAAAAEGENIVEGRCLGSRCRLE